MSDDTGDAEFEASLANLPADGDGGSVTAAADGQSALSSRLDDVHGTLSTLGMRVDALVTSTTSYRSALTDRLAEYSELVTKTARNQSADLEEYRRTTERVVAEVRRSLSASEEAVGALASKLGAAGGGGGVSDADAERVVTEVRGILEAQERLSSFLTESLDRFGETVLGRVDDSQSAVLTGIDGLRQSVEAIAAQGPPEDLRADLVQLRTTVEQFSSRDIAAALREDLLQIRAIAATTAERDHSTDLATIRGSLEALAARDVAAELREELTGLRDLVVAAQAADPAAVVLSELEPFQAALDNTFERIATLETATGRLASGVEALTRADRTDEVLTAVSGLATSDEVTSEVASVRQQVLDALDALRQQQASAASTEQVGGLAADLRAHLIDALGGLDGTALSTDMAAVRDAVDGEASAVATALDQLRETLLDVASGEVLGSLWDEFRALRTSVEAMTDGTDVAAGRDEALDDVRAGIAALQAGVAGLAAADEASPGAADLADAAADLPGALAAIQADLATLNTTVRAMDERLVDLPASEPDRTPDLAFVHLRESVEELTGEVRTLLEAAEIDAPVDGDPGFGPDDVESLADDGWQVAADASTDALARIDAELGAMRAELHDGLVIEPSPELLDVLADLRAELAQLQRTVGAPAGPSEGASSGDPATAAALDALREAVEGVQARLDEGLVLADDDGLAGGAVDEGVADQVASLRDLLTTEMDLLRAQLTATAKAPASAPAPSPDPADKADDDDDVVVTLDPDTLDLLRSEIREAGGGSAAVDPTALEGLREEIRAAGGVSDQVVDALRDELRALRRRIAVKAQEKVLDEAQLAQIADAVAERLGRS